jgi:MoaA/NifB/PqqE/SkfB family radical SAM enzyme
LIKPLLKIPAYWLFRKTGKPQLLPFGLTVNVTNRCNARCKTCGIYKKSPTELSLDEFGKVFAGFKKDIFWLCITGGEPFLRKDLREIIRSAYINLHPGIISIPTNGILYERIPEEIDKILKECPKAKIIVNLSLDGFGEQHDRIRGVKDNFKLEMETFERLRLIINRNFTLGIHSVVSKYNIEYFNTFSKKLLELKPDSYILEIAQERKEFDNIGLDVQPDLSDYLGKMNYFKEYLRQRHFKGTSRIIQSFRSQYYDLVARTISEKKQLIPCYAGFNSAYITSNGEVWACCVKGQSIGNLKDKNYDFRKLWFSPEASQVRRQIKNSGCFCVTAGMSYLNMICDINSLWKIGLRLFFSY